MDIKEINKIIQKFLQRIKLHWQILFLSSVLIYGISFIYRLESHTLIKPLSYLRILNLVSFIIALALAFTIFYFKRKYFRFRFFRVFLEKLSSEDPTIQETGAIKKLTQFIGKRMKILWYMGAALVLLGVIYYWWTFDAWNMHVYFIVGLYSLVINYPRRDLFTDLPYLIQESFKNKTEGNG
jgi:hypothetical protein